MQLIRATEADSDRLKEFFRHRLLPGPIDFSIERRGSFFAHYRLQSEDFETLLLIDDHGELAGLATLLFRTGLVNGEKQTWGVACDLRIAPSRKAVVQWAQHFLPELERLTAARGCRYVFSAMQLYDNQAYNALVRPQPERRAMPRYYQVTKFRLMCLHGRVPFAPRPLATIDLKPADLNDLEELCAFLAARALKKPVALLHEPERFLKRLSRWPGLELSDFRLARDRRGKLLGCAALWDGRDVQAFVPQTYKGLAHTAHQSLNFAAWLGLARPTAQPLETMPMRYLTHLASESADVFHSLVHEAFTRLENNEFLAYGHFRGSYATLPPRGWIATSLPFGLFLVLPPTETAPNWLLPGPQTMPPEFEVAWL
jgi:hypothetical protein